MPLADGFLLGYITDRKGLTPGELPVRLREAIEANLSWVQIREKDACAREMCPWVAEAVQAASGRATQILVNDRLDVVLACGADGVHLGGHSVPAAVARKWIPKPRRVGVSCHSLEEAQSAQEAAADYILLGPIFQPFSKTSSLPPLGLEGLRKVCREIQIPVLALGGISPRRILPCREAGARGVAAIAMFQDCRSLRERVEEIQKHLR